MVHERQQVDRVKRGRETAVLLVELWIELGLAIGL